MKSAYSYIKKAVREKLREKLIEWRKQNSIVRIDKPTDIGRARTLGYKDKKGFVVVRVRIKRGGRKRPKRKKGRRTKRQTIRKTLKMNYRWVSETRAGRKYKNLEVLNSYKIAQDGKHYFYEVILVDPSKTEIKKSRDLSWISKRGGRRRALRGLTSAGKKSRGLRKRSRQLKSRPSVRAKGRRGK